MQRPVQHPMVPERGPGAGTGTEGEGQTHGQGHGDTGTGKTPPPPCGSPRPRPQHGAQPPLAAGQGGRGGGGGTDGRADRRTEVSEAAGAPPGAGEAEGPLLKRAIPRRRLPSRRVPGLGRAPRAPSFGCCRPPQSPPRG